MAASPRMTITPATATQGRRTSSSTQRFVRRFPPGRVPRARALDDQIRSPTIPSRAGSSVRAMSTARVTVVAATSAMVVRNPMPMTVIPTSAMTTVDPAKTTALPAVATARAVASAVLSPSVRTNRRCRWTMNKA